MADPQPGTSGTTDNNGNWMSEKEEEEQQDSLISCLSSLSDDDFTDIFDTFILDPRLWCELPRELVSMVLERTRTDAFSSLLTSLVNLSSFRRTLKHPIVYKTIEGTGEIYTGTKGLSIDFDVHHYVSVPPPQRGRMCKLLYSKYVIHSTGEEDAQSPSTSNIVHFHYSTRKEAVQGFTRSLLVFDMEKLMVQGCEGEVCLDYGIYPRRIKDLTFYWTAGLNSMRRLTTFLDCFNPEELTIVLDTDINDNSSKVMDDPSDQLPFHSVVPNEFFELPQVQALDALSIHGSMESIVLVTEEQIRHLKATPIFMLGVKQTLGDDEELEDLERSLNNIDERSLYVNTLLRGAYDHLYIHPREGALLSELYNLKCELREQRRRQSCEACGVSLQFDSLE